MSNGQDRLARDVESAGRLLNDTAMRASNGFDSVKSSIDELVEANDALRDILSDTVDRLIEAEAKIAVLEAKQ